ncbi:hypothetical protein [Sulfurimonas sp. HSL-1716]|uniref:hypothetical protein n=1 Tax=Hydrocurvibacter sulfurireducens TaxID=3131937 RepID=UPI0031F8BA3A
MLIFDIAVYLLLSVMACIVLVRFFVVYRGFVPLLLVAFLTILLVLFKTSLPDIFSYRINSFYITYHNADAADSQKYLPKTDTRVDIEYLAKTFHHDRKKDFYVMMDGYFVNVKPVKKEIYTDIKQAKAEVYLDGELVLASDSQKKELLVNLSKGVHHLRIYIYASGRSKAVMRAGINDFTPVISDENMTKELKKIVKNKAYDLFFTAQNSDRRMNLQDSAKPSVLFIDSADAAAYDIRNIKGSNTKAVVYAGVGARFKFDGNVSLLRIKEMPEIYKVYPKKLECVNHAPFGIECSTFSELAALNAWMRKLLGKKITGFTDGTNKKETPVKIPQIEFDTKRYDEINGSIEAMRLQKEELQRRLADPFYRYKGKRWHDVLHVNDAQIPSNSFKAYYMDKFDVSNIRYSENVFKIAVDYVKNGFHDIRADNFVGYWVGDFIFARPVTYEFDVNVSHADIRVMVDGKAVYEGNSSKSFDLKFKPGKKYRIEVGYINDYPHAKLLLNMKNAHKHAF